MNFSNKLCCVFFALVFFPVHASCIDVDNAYNHTVAVISKTEVTTQVRGNLLNKNTKEKMQVLSSDKIVSSEAPYSNSCFYNANDKMLTLIYGFDSDKLSVKHKSSLRDYLDNAGKVTSIEIEGHADSSGDSKYNVKLSSRRANNVAQYIRNEIGKNVKISMKAYGESQPSCSVEINKRKGCNRRTSLTVLH